MPRQDASRDPAAERIDVSIRNAQLAHLAREPLAQNFGRLIQLSPILQNQCNHRQAQTTSHNTRQNEGNPVSQNSINGPEKNACEQYYPKR